LDTGKQTLEADRRANKASQVFLKWVLTLHTVNYLNGGYAYKSYFRVLDGKKVKYRVKITSDGIYDSCSCMSFKFGMKYPLPKDQTVPFTSLYFAEHGHTFHCKHIIAAIVTKGKMK